MTKKLINWFCAAVSGVSPFRLPSADLATPAAADSRPAVVLLHGIYDDGDKMLWLASRFQAQGYETYTPSMEPADGSVPLDQLAAQFDQKLQSRFPAGRRLHVVGFSMGGIITRQWLTHQADLSRVASFTTLGSPHHGTVLADWNKTPGARQMRRGSDFLKQLETLDSKLTALPILSLYTPMDLVILPANSSVWAAADQNEKINLAMHPQLVFSRKVARRLLLHFEQAEVAP